MKHGLGTSRDDTVGNVIMMRFKAYNDELARSRTSELEAFDMNHVGGER